MNKNNADSDKLFRFMAETMPKKIFTAEPNGEIDYFSPAWRRYTGQTSASMLQLDWFNFIHPDDILRSKQAWETSLRTGRAFEQEQRLMNKNGIYRWHRTRIHAMKDKAGQIIKWVGASTDKENLIRSDKRRKELEASTKILKRDYSELLNLNRSKDDFISLASHQLRTPATAVKQYLGMLLAGYMGDLGPKQQRMAQAAYDSNERQILIVNDLLKVAQVDAGKMKLKKVPTDLVPLTRDIILEQSAKFTQKNQKIEFIHESKSARCTIDPDKIRMVIENLIDNARKYTHENKSIKIFIKNSPGYVELGVKDQGVGIASTYMPKLFQKFSRIDNPLSIISGGTGLGLYLVKNIVELHGGTIRVSSKINQGSTFRMKLPKK